MHYNLSQIRGSASGGGGGGGERRGEEEVMGNRAMSASIACVNPLPAKAFVPLVKIAS